MRMIISIGGQAGSGKSTTATLLAKKLRYRHYSIGDLRRKMAKERGLTLAELNRLGETQEFTDREADEYQRKLGKREDDFVIDGRASFFFIPHSVKVYLDARLEVRAQRVYRDEKRQERFASLEQARAALAERERSDTKRYKKYYKLDWVDKGHYDLVIDTSDLRPEQVVEKILKFVKGRKG